MASASGCGDCSGPFVWDTSALLHASRAGRLDVLGSFVSGSTDQPWRHYLTATGVDEMRQLGNHPPDWVSVVHVDGLDEIIAFAEWSMRLVSGPHHRGEAAVAAWAESHRAIAIIDDREASQVMKREGLHVHGSLWMLCKAIKAGESMSGPRPVSSTR
jgi:predicted nucleic acid-binding protein